ncbi:MAG: hypothetical protein U0798_06720 [Gemmataceae bacterium]
MLRKIVLSTLVALGMIGGVAMSPATAQADHRYRPIPQRYQHHNSHSAIVVRHHGHWDVYRPHGYHLHANRYYPPMVRDYHPHQSRGNVIWGFSWGGLPYRR